jgi:hypothetical protein
MQAWSFVRSVTVGIAGAALALGCVVQSEPGSGYEQSGAGGPGGGSGSGSGSGGTSSQPMLVDVDPNQILTATPGDGVVVAVEYQTGGHWNIWWTCDTNKSQQGCPFDNVVTVATGSITNVLGQQNTPTSEIKQGGSQRIEAVTSTTTGIDGMTFDTPFTAGQTPIITLTVSIAGVQSAQGNCPSGQGACNIIFFVQDGEVDGNFSGALTDPLMLEPKTP